MLASISESNNGLGTPYMGNGEYQHCIISVRENGECHNFGCFSGEYPVEDINFLFGNIPLLKGFVYFGLVFIGLRMGTKYRKYVVLSMYTYIYIYIYIYVYRFTLLDL